MVGTINEAFAISPGALIFWGQMAITYLLAVPVTAFMAKRGLFLGADRIWFPGLQDGSGAYQKEKEIFGSVEIRVREAPIDLWVLGILMLISWAVLFLTWGSIKCVASIVVVTSVGRLASNNTNHHRCYFYRLFR